MSAYCPDGWVVVQLGKSDYRVFGSWRGGYLSGDWWRVNSGIAETFELDYKFEVVGNSGSNYMCYKELYGAISAYNSSVLANIIERRSAVVLSEDEAFEVLRKFIKEGE